MPITLFLECLKAFFQIFLRFMDIWKTSEEAERKIIEDRIKTWSKLTTEICINKQERYNEDAFRLSLDMEKQIRYDGYKKSVAGILTNGGGVLEITSNQYMGMNTRLLGKKTSVIDILAKDIGIGDKAGMIAKLAVE